jgi:putative DNA primase/helicase
MSEQLGRIEQCVDQARVAELAKLPRLQYDRVRKSEAKSLGVTVGTLDGEVAVHRSKAAEATLIFADPDSWPDSVNGAELLDRIRLEVEAYVVLPPYASTAIALWALHTWCAESFYISPFLHARSPEKRCGKTTLMMVLAELVRRPLPATNASPAALFRCIEKYQPTLLLDEADTWMRENEELRGILNGGHSRRTAQVLRLVGDEHEVRAFSTYCPKVISGIGRLVDTLEDRSVIVVMKRKRTEDGVQRLRQDQLNCLDIRRQCRRWTEDCGNTLRELDPAMPRALNDRAADNWRPLLAIADTVGGPWPAAARAAALALSGQTEDEANGAQLLADIQSIFGLQAGDLCLGAEGTDCPISSAELADALGAMEDRPWSEWRQGKPITKSQLARLLKPFDVRPKTVRLGPDTAKGYRRSQFADAFSRYLSAVSQVVTPSQTQENGSESEVQIRNSGFGENRHTVTPLSGTAPLCDGVTSRPSSGVTAANGGIPQETTEYDGVTDQMAELGLGKEELTDTEAL